MSAVGEIRSVFADASSPKYTLGGHKAIGGGAAGADAHPGAAHRTQPPGGTDATRNAHAGPGSSSEPPLLRSLLALPPDR